MRGWMVGAAAAVCYTAGLRLGYPGLAVLGVGGALALAAAELWVAVPVPLRVRREIAPGRVPRGEPALGLLTCTHAGRWIRVVADAADRCGADEVTVRLPGLRPGESRTTSYRLPTSRRGQIAVGPLRMTTVDPLGLARRVRECGATLTLQVQPRVVALVAPLSVGTAGLHGPAPDRAAGGAVTFRTLRPYVSGDDRRHIHWRTSARTNTLMVRQLVDTTPTRTVVLLDNRAAVYPTEPDFELAVDVTASVASAAVRLGFPVSVVTGDRTVSTVDGDPGQAAVLLASLASVEATTGTDLSLAAVLAGSGQGTLTVVTGAGGWVDLPRIADARRFYDQAVVVRVGVDLPPAPALPLVLVDAPDLARFALAWRQRAAR